MEEDYFSCGLDRTIQIIGNKWAVAIVFELMKGQQRFNQLQHRLNISPRTLSLRLHQLEADGIVRKKIYAQVPAKVEYTLTRHGKSLSEVIDQMRQWGCQNQK